MAKPLRSPLLGYNHNLTHLGRVFHIQTEDSGPLMPRLFTHLFYEGTILVSRKQEYDANLPDDRVRGLMQTQHKMVMKDLVRARLNGVIIPFFNARGEDLTPAEGAVPAATLSETSGPMMVLPQAADGSVADEVAEDMHAPVDLPRESAGAPARATTAAGLPQRKVTRPIEKIFQRGSTPEAAAVHASEARRPPFFSSGSPAAARTSSTDGVVVQRNVVVGGGGPSVGSRPSRIRPPVPYVVAGGGHTERPPKSALSAAVSQPPGATEAAAMSSAPVASGPTAPMSASGVPNRLTGGFGISLADDKSLDEVILEYLSEDGDSP
jgi:hypothetical protein